MKIKSVFTFETGRWDRKTDSFVNKVKTTQDKILDMIILTNNANPILKFIGGPTGFESYYIQDLIESKITNDNNEFCICGGTTNSWARCTVNKKEVFDFIDSQRHKL